MGDGEVHVVINPVSGRSGSRVVLWELCRRIQATGRTIVVCRTRKAGDAQLAARRACLAGASALLVAGGDGTISEAVGGMRDRGVPILIVPCGTENILAKYLGSALDVESLWRTFLDGREIVMDVPTMNGRCFMLLGGIGFDAEVVSRLSRERKGHISYLTYFWPIWRTFWGHPFSRLSVVADAKTVFDGPGLAFVGNVPRYAIGLRILERARPNDGLLDVCVMRCERPDQLLGHAVNVLARRHVGRDAVVYVQARRVRISAPEEPVPIQLDGDLHGWLPAEFEMTSLQVRFRIRPDRPTAAAERG